MLAVFAEFERSTYIERMQGAKRAKAAAGGYVGGKPLARRFGSRLVPTSDGHEYIDVPNERAIIDKMVAKYRDGDTLEAIATWLTDEKQPTTTGARRWSRQAVALILRREGVELRPRGRRRG